MANVKRRLHWAGEERCQRKNVVATSRIEDVTCRDCVDRLYRAALFAHSLAFRESVGPRIRRLEAAAARATSRNL